MIHRSIFLASTAALLTACGPGEPDPMPAPAPPAGESAQTGSDAGMTASRDETAANGDAEPFETEDTELDVEAALGAPAADGEWFDQPTWTGYGPPASEAVFMIRCGDYGMVQLTRMVDIDPARPARGAIAAGDEVEEGYWTGEDAAELPAAHFELYASAPIFETMADADKIAVLVEGEDDLVIPGSPAITARLESCRDSPTP